MVHFSPVTQESNKRSVKPSPNEGETLQPSPPACAHACTSRKLGEFSFHLLQISHFYLLSCDRSKVHHDFTDTRYTHQSIYTESRDFFLIGRVLIANKSLDESINQKPPASPPAERISLSCRRSCLFPLARRSFRLVIALQHAISESICRLACTRCSTCYAPDRQSGRPRHAPDTRFLVLRQRQRDP